MQNKSPEVALPRHVLCLHGGGAGLVEKAR
jgi:hypothetical protein